MYISSLTKKVIYQCSIKPILSPNYQHLQTTFSKDLKTYLHEYAHQGTNARIYHFQNADSENAFASVVKTYVDNDTGCPHILEHLATCGSHKYPVRDPFFNMIRRSVNTFMNAWTGDDFTSYPFSSANPTDWKNLYNVYLDMSFKALLNELDFRQEGWRYEIDSQGKRELKGIVLNEMKGAYQDSDRQLFKEIFTELFRNTPYVNDSGGRPAQIVNLEYSQLRKMYDHYYHPSNMAFFYYGNGLIEDHLNFLDKQYLSKYKDSSNLYNKVNLKPAPVQNKHKTITSYTSQSNNITINYFLGQYKEILPIQIMALRIVSYILLQKSNALLYKKFIQSGIAQNIGFAGLNQAQLTTFSFTLKGIYSNYECQVFQTAFKQVLQTLLKQGIPPQRLNEYSHQFEINLLTPRQNNGIKVLQQTIALMTHRLDFELSLSPRTFLNQAVRKLSNPEYLAKIINKFFLNNQQMIVIRQLLAETENVETPIQSKLIIDDKVIKEQQEQLLIRQNTKQNNNILPMLKMEDILKPSRISPILTNHLQVNGKVYQQYHVKIRQEVNFYRLIFNYKEVDANFLKNITLWMYNLNKIISTKNYDYNQLTAQLANTTAGFNVSHSIGGQEDFNIVFQFSCLKSNKDKAFSLLEQIIFSPKFEKDHTVNSFRAFNNEITESIISNPMGECLSQAAGQLTKAGAILNSYQRIKESLSIIENNEIQGLYHTSLEINKCSNIRLIEHSNEEFIQKPKLVDQLLSFAPEPMKSFDFSQKIQPKAITFSYNVNFCAQQYLAPKFLSKQHAYLNLLLEVLQHEYIHPLIREKGGAYGSNSRIRNNGTISFSSYMDPNSTSTFDAFDSSIKKILQRDSIDDQSLLQAKIKQFGEVDRVKIPQNEGVNQIIRGYTEEQYDQFRETLKTAKFNEIVETGRRYLLDVPKSRCIFGKEAPEGFIEEKLKNFLL